MKNFHREYPLFSLCGLNCGLCTIRMGGYCPGCGGGEGNQGCAIARCGIEKCVDFCIHCKDYSCPQYDGIDAYDSFVTHLHQKQDLAKLGRIGLDAYSAELDEKMVILDTLLEQYNDGRHKSPFCTAVNLLELHRLREIMAALSVAATAELPPKERARLAASKLVEAAEAQGLSLKLRKKK